MPLSKLSFSNTKQKLLGAVMSRHDQPVRPSFFELLPEIRDLIFYFAFRELRIHLIHWDEYPQPRKSKRPPWVPSTIECVPLLRVSKVHYHELRTALLRHATIVVCDEKPIKKIENDATIGHAIRKICIWPSIWEDPLRIHQFLVSVPNLSLVTFSICRSGTVGMGQLGQGAAWKLKPWAVCKDGKCQKIRRPLLLEALQLSYDRLRNRTQDPIAIYIAKWGKEIERKSGDNIDVAVELNIWIKVAGSHRARFIPDRENSLRGRFRHCIRLGWTSVVARMKLREAVLRFRVDGHSYAISQV